MDISGETRLLVDKQFQKVKEAHQHMARLKQTHATGNTED